ncbi:MAG: cobalamin-dependent protein, partial [Candidatus Omnitrophica bacterium]|nr:cobalamin-dependent protein [Candidatus Omnitrophota bacterium]
MKVALINPAVKGAGATVEPLNLGYIAGYLEQNGIEVAIIDQLAGEDVFKEITRSRPDVVGVSCMTPMATDAYRIADTCRRKGILTVMGGPHPSAMPE